MTDLAVQRPQTVLSNDQLTYIANTEFVPAGLRGNLPAILACVATGRALGIDDMTAIRSIHVIDGKATFSAELMVQLVRRAGHSITGDVGEGTATVKGRRTDNGDEMTVTWTLAMAERAGLANKGNWKKYPEAMLWARAVSQLCRMLFADCFAGATYTTEELGDQDTGPDAAPVTEERRYTVSEKRDRETDPDPPASDDGLFPPADQPQPGAAVPRGMQIRTGAQAKKLNVLVGQLRPVHISTEDLWRSQLLDPDAHREPDGSLHWSPLRDRLSRDQAHNLIDRLERLAEKVKEPEFEIPPLQDMP